MVKNFLITSLYKINKWKNEWDRKKDGDIYEIYDKYVYMLELSRRSFISNLSKRNGDYEEIVFEFEVDNILDVFRDHFHRLHDFWKKNKPCNILYCGPDTIAINKVNVFGEYNHFLMFYFTDPTFYDDGKYKIDKYFNADVRYYPSFISDVWEKGLEIAKDWDFEKWDMEQIVWNYMLWSQDIEFKKVNDSSMAFQGFFLPNLEYAEDFNGRKLNKAKIVHLHASRDLEDKIKIMERLFIDHVLSISNSKKSIKIEIEKINEVSLNIKNMKNTKKFKYSVIANDELNLFMTKLNNPMFIYLLVKNGESVSHFNIYGQKIDDPDYVKFMNKGICKNNGDKKDFFMNKESYGKRKTYFNKCFNKIDQFKLLIDHYDILSTINNEQCELVIFD